MNLYAIGKITGSFGLAGYLKIQLYTQTPERLKKLHQVFVGHAIEEVQSYKIEDLIFRNRKVLVKFGSVDDRTAAEKIMGSLIFIEEHEVKAPPKGTYFTHDIIGCEVWSTDGQSLGIVEDVHSFPAQDVWTVRKGAKVSLVPAVKEFIEKVDIKDRKIIVKLIEGLIEE